MKSCELWSRLLEGGLYGGSYKGTTIGVIKGDTMSLDYSSCYLPDYTGVTWGFLGVYAGIWVALIYWAQPQTIS